MAGTFDITLDKGATKAFTVRIKNPDGSARNISTLTSAKIDVRRGFEGSELMFSVTDGDGIDTTSASTGVLLVTYSDTQTALLDDDVFRHELQITFPATKESKFKGEITVSRRITT